LRNIHENTYFAEKGREQSSVSITIPLVAPIYVYPQDWRLVLPVYIGCVITA
jgi:hypothetical protein